MERGRLYGGTDGSGVNGGGSDIWWAWRQGLCCGNMCTIRWTRKGKAIMPIRKSPQWCMHQVKWVLYIRSQCPETTDRAYYTVWWEPEQWAVYGRCVL